MKEKKSRWLHAWMFLLLCFNLNFIAMDASLAVGNLIPGISLTHAKKLDLSGLEDGLIRSSIYEDNGILVGSRLYYTKIENDRRDLWVKDLSTKQLTRLIRNFPLNYDDYNNNIFSFRGKLYWFENTSEPGKESLLKTIDGTPESIQTILSFPSEFDRHIILNKNKLIFVSDEALWVSDGTAAGTNLLSPCSCPFYNFTLTAVGDKVIANLSYYPTNNIKLLITDGTKDGTEIIYAFSNLDKPVAMEPLGALQDKFYLFRTKDSDRNTKLWITDTTGSEIRYLTEGGAGTSYKIAENNGQLFFAFSDKLHGTELWVTDGSPEGTRMVKDIRPGTRNGLYHYLHLRGYVVGDKLYFLANDGAHGEELWVTDGTEANTYMVYDLRVGSTSSSPDLLAHLGDHLYFRAYGGGTQGSLWVTDGSINSAHALPVSIGFHSAIKDNQIYFADWRHPDSVLIVSDQGLPLPGETVSRFSLTPSLVPLNTAESTIEQNIILTLANPPGAPDKALGKIKVVNRYPIGFKHATNCGAQLKADEHCRISLSRKKNLYNLNDNSIIVQVLDPEGEILAQSLLTTERLQVEAKRRLPPVLTSLKLPTLKKNQTTTIEWSLTGFDDKTYSQVVMFDCATDDNGEPLAKCGEDYTTRTQSSAMLAPYSHNAGKRNFRFKAKSVEHHYRYTFTPKHSGPVVLRFYQASDMDHKTGSAGISVLIPDNLQDMGGTFNYFDRAGRRLSSYVH